MNANDMAGSLWRKIERLAAIEAAALEFVRDSHRPEAKHDAERFDRLCIALGVELEDEQ